MTVALQVDGVFTHLYLQLATLRQAHSGRQLPNTLNNPIDRGIAYVLFIDIVGYSNLLNQEQQSAVEKLTEIVRATNEVKRAEAIDQLIKIPTGDGVMLLFFGTPEQPIRCAIEISTALQQEANLPVRMGMDSGPVNATIDINEQRNATGGPINNAQRIMNCGEAGHILLSRHIAEDLAHLKEWKSCLHEVGECKVKHGRIVFLVNFFNNGVGNPESPQNVGKQVA